MNAADTVNDATRKLEDDVIDAVNKFSQSTGLAVSNIELTRYRITHAAVYHSATATIESIAGGQA